MTTFAQKRIAYAKSQYKYFFLAGVIFGFVAGMGFAAWYMSRSFG